MGDHPLDVRSSRLGHRLGTGAQRQGAQGRGPASHPAPDSGQSPGLLWVLRRALPSPPLPDRSRGPRTGRRNPRGKVKWEAGSGEGLRVLARPRWPCPAPPVIPDQPFLSGPQFPFLCRGTMTGSWGPKEIKRDSPNVRYQPSAALPQAACPLATSPMVQLAARPSQLPQRSQGQPLGLPRLRVMAPFPLLPFLVRAAG